MVTKTKEIERCARCGKSTGTRVTLEFKGKKTPPLCSKCFDKHCREAPKRKAVLTPRRKDGKRERRERRGAVGKGSAVKEPEVVDVETGEVLKPEACAERLRLILAKEAEIQAAEMTLTEAKNALAEIEASAKTGRELVTECRESVKALEGELRDLVRGQTLLF